MNGTFQTALSLLGSKDLQTRYCVNATADEYLLPEELLESAVHRAELSIKNGNIDEEQRQAIERFLSTADEVMKALSSDTSGPSTPDLILNNLWWEKARAAASLCLDELGWRSHPSL